MKLECVKCGYIANSLKFSVFDDFDKRSFCLVCPECKCKKIRIMWSLGDKIRRKLSNLGEWWHNER